MAYRYRIGQVCKNGHIITGDINDGDAANFCTRCGEQTVSECGKCGAKIRGNGTDEDWGGYYPMSVPPSFCHECGAPFTWTERAIYAAKELADEIENIDDGERERAKESFVALASDTPQTPVAATRVRKMLDKAGPVIGKAIRDILVSIATDAAKKQMGL